MNPPPTFNLVEHHRAQYFQAFAREIAVLCSGPNRNDRRKFVRRAKKHRRDQLKALARADRAMRIHLKKINTL